MENTVEQWKNDILIETSKLYPSNKFEFTEYGLEIDSSIKMPMYWEEITDESLQKEINGIKEYITLKQFIIEAIKGILQ